MAPSGKIKKPAKGKPAAANAAAAALSKSDDAASNAAVPVAEGKPKPEYDSPARSASKTKVSAGSSPVTAAQVSKATHALLKFLETQTDLATPKKPNLLGDEAEEGGSHGIYNSDQVWLVVTTMKNLVNKKDLKPKTVKIPYPLLHPETTSALLLVKDPQRAYKDILLPSSPTVRKVLGLSKLRAKFNTYETLRQLRDTHDLILTDERIMPSLRTALGSSFLRTTTKIPIPIRIAKKNGKPASQEAIEKEVKKAVEAAHIHLAHTNSTNVRIGLVKHSAEQLMENVLAVIAYMITERKCIKAGWKGVRGVYIKSSQSAALPLYLAPRIYDGEKDVTTAEQREEEKKVSEEKKKANEERRKAKKAKKLAARKGISWAASAPEANGTNGDRAAEPAQKKRKAEDEDKKEEIESAPKSKKQKITTVAKGEQPAAPTTKVEIPAQKGKKSKSETATAPAPAAEEKKKKANVSKAKAAKEAKTQGAEGPIVEKAVEKAVEEEKAKEVERPAAKAARKKGKTTKVDKPEEEKAGEKKEGPKRRSKRASIGGKT